MKYLSAAQVLFIHARLISETGGAPGIRDLGLLVASIARPQATFGGEDLYPDLFTKAAALMDSLIRNHPFVDGNKRAGITAAGIFLLLNGRRLTASNATLEQFTLLVAQSQVPFLQMAKWFQNYSKEIDSNL
ncbi:MAG: type II toxin-antitoxin system death-on-curing family toxin [Chloroflexi bacterium]|nr:MAG: type II toxin-antitoxin system death-on-curing family toxin [Chloroflexota bacterium]